VGVPLSRAAAHEGRSLVAGANALFRAAESRRRRPIVHDPYAHLFGERDPRVTLVRAARFAVPSLGRALRELQVAHCVRHRAVDELVVRALDAGFRQVVIVGAGYDMRAARFARDGVRFVEVDAPATQEKKREILSRAVAPRVAVERAGVDLMEGTLEDALAATAFDWHLDTCFVVEGVVHYLSLPRFDALMAACARGHGRSRVVLSFIRSDMVSRATPAFARLVRLVREVPRLHFHRAELEAVCARHGFSGMTTWSFDEQVAELAPAARGRAATLTQDVAVVERG
jgi:methyltransferase (TIGR00027 family)